MAAEPKSAVEESARGAAGAVLPSPAKERWHPLRSGLLNLYRYDEEEFPFEEGRLLLRGNNGTGKSRVLALQLPFLLDGEIAPHRVEPDGDPAKRMEWNLLMGRYDERLELAPDGKHLTITYTWDDPVLYVRPHTYQYLFERLPEDSYALETWCDSSDPRQRQSIVPPAQVK